jgi:hypothetical protein
MSQQSIQNEIDLENKYLSRIATQLDGMPTHQENRLDTAKHSTHVALARVYGNRLNEHVSKRIVEGIVLNPAVLCTITGGMNELPTSQQGWDSFARELVDSEPLAKLSIDHADAELKDEIRAEAMCNMRPEDKIKMARAGTLDDHLAGIVAAKLEARSFR